MFNPKQLIDELDELRAKATQGEWGDLHLDGVYFENSDGYMGLDHKRNYENACHIVSLYNAYPALRRAALAGEVLAERLQRDHDSGDCGNAHRDELSTYRQALEEDK